MMKQYVVDAFTDKVFAGNPAAVCVMQEWPSEELMKNIALENNFSETAFTVKEGDAYLLRWFTPGGEIDLCGHATLATAYVITEFYEPGADVVHFNTTMSGPVTVEKRNGLFELNFPAFELKKVPVTDDMEKVMGARPKEAYLGRDLLCVFDDEQTVRAMKPDLEAAKSLDGLLLNVTAPGKTDDCVSRTFAPKLNVPEDPVCGSGHCHIIPYWTEKTGRKSITAYQASRRGGTLYCRMENGRVIMGGKAALFSKAELDL